MGTMTIPMTPFQTSQPCWPALRPQQRLTRKPSSTPELPMQRDARGTLLAPFQEVALLRTGNEASGIDSAGNNTAVREPWRTDASAAPEVSAERAAEIAALHTLVFACMRGNSAAWQQLVTSQHRRVYGICYRFTGSPTDAEDLTQDVFLKVYRNLQGFDPAKGAFTTWLTTLTRNLLVDHFRRTRQDRSTDSLDESTREDGDGPTLADQLADTRLGQLQRVAQMELRVRIQHALKQLSPELREAVILRDLQDMDYKEIAAVLKVPEGTVKSRISRGRGELARMLGRTEGRVV
ncbi:MAG: RNA polymerase sigma factor [Janthinobacterium lividum]